MNKSCWQEGLYFPVFHHIFIFLKMILIMKTFLMEALYFTCRHKMGSKLSPKYFLHLFYCCFNIVCRKPLTVYKRAPFKEIFTVLYGQKRTQTMCKTCFETPKEQTRHGLVPKRDSFLLFFLKTFFVLLPKLKIKRILKQNRRQPEFVEAASPHGHQPANIG